MLPMEFLDDEAQVEARFGPFGDSANLDTRYMIGLRRTYHRVRNHFTCNQWYSEVMRLMQKLISVYLETVLILTQDTYTVCTEHTIGLEIVLDAPNESHR
jgi:galactitol-specific phosphotransferase system IIC component